MKVKNQYLKILEYLHLSFVVFLYRYERWIFTVYNHIIHKQFIITRFIFTSWVNGCCWKSQPLSPGVRPGSVKSSPLEARNKVLFRF